MSISAEVDGHGPRYPCRLCSGISSGDEKNVVLTPPSSPFSSSSLQPARSLALDEDDRSSKMLATMDQIRKGAQDDNTSPYGGSPVGRTRVDGQRGGETGEHDRKGAIHESEQIDGQTPAAERPARGRQWVAFQPLQAQTPNGDHVGTQQGE